MIEVIPQLLISSLLLAGLYSMIAIGWTITYGVLGLANFAYGEFIMLGMYVTYWLFTLYGLSPLLGMAVSAIILFAIGSIFERFAIKPILDAPHITQFLLTFGLSMTLTNFALMVWKGNVRSLTTWFSQLSIPVGFIHISISRLIILGFSATIVAITYIVIMKTDRGTAIRAVAQDRQAAALLGINVHQIFLLTFGIASALAGAAGGLITLIYPITPFSGFNLALKGFLIIVLGGMGSIKGALVGSLIVAFVEGIISVFVPVGWITVIVFMLIVTLLVAMPKGLFGIY